MRIYLIGYMGSGKTTLGRKLAEHSGLQFIDMDHYIEERNRKTVAHIFANEGEDSFRRKEQKALEELSEFTNVVIATGGGAPCFFDNIQLMNKTGKTIFLNIDSDIIAKRLSESKTERPLIKGKQEDELISFINESLKKRNEFYLQAQYHVTDPDITPADIMKIIETD